MDTKALRQKILDLAIRGKLVPQDPNDEPASVLLERIRAEKQQMVKDGKLKPKDIKNDTVIFKGDDNLHYEQFDDGTVKCIEDEIPFELPDGWSWAHLSDIVCVLNGDRGQNYPAKSKLQRKGIPFVSASNIKDSVVSSNGLLCLSDSQYNALGAGKLVAGDIVYCIRGSLGKCGVFTMEKGAIASSLVIVRSLLIEPYITDYIFLYLNSPFADREIKKYDNGSAQPNLAAKDFMHFLIPVPPLEEIQRINEQAREALGLVKHIQNGKDELLATISATKSKILDLAIRGKLVPQDPNDEPASVLLERIRVEKEKLIKQGKIKRDKKESVIFKGEDNSYYEKIGDEITCIDDFLPFDIPDTWTWTRLKNIGDVIGGGTPKTNNHNYWDGEIPWVTPADLSGYNNMYIAYGSRFITELGLKESSAQLLPKDSVLFSSRAPIGYIAIAENAIATNQGFKSVSPYISGISEYLYFCLKRCTDDIIQRASGTTFKEISGSEMSETLVPIPSLNEQKKIVNLISDLFAAINNGEASLN